MFHTFWLFHTFYFSCNVTNFLPLILLYNQFKSCNHSKANTLLYSSICWLIYWYSLSNKINLINPQAQFLNICPINKLTQLLFIYWFNPIPICLPTLTFQQQWRSSYVNSNLSFLHNPTFHSLTFYHLSQFTMFLSFGR